MVRTEEALCSAMKTLMQKHSPEDILVEDICQEARVKRSVFYAYFTDQYDLLNYCQNS